ncbi:uncharacterized protein LOC117336557 [Pecten maximus]|uniref:uncharacterized protein LOC117336557 n=1 Tax=Pecten maximus TaxID=6579 RepID=UPI001458BF87|nr:uncharacterized protein LOC117336557 [Pecten maximus]
MGGVWERMIGTSRRILDSMLLAHNKKDLTHEVLCTFMAEVCAIVNARPIVSVSSDPESPSVLSPALLLTHKCGPTSEPFTNLDIRDAYKSQWRYVQFLAETFWKRRKQEYLNSLQKSQKWHRETSNLKEGDVVLMKDDQSGHRNNWPMGVIERTFPSDEGLVRKVEVRVSRCDGETTTFVRPVSELILLISE